MPFTSLGLSPALTKALVDQNFTVPTPIQQSVIPAILAHKDVLAIAKTGSGKTASYVLPLLMNVQKTFGQKNRHANVLVLVPTRELAEQVKNVFITFSQPLPESIKTLAVYGGVSINPQMMAMQGINILVATPGRLLELVASNAVHLSAIETLVLDEADKMLNLGFKEELNKILSLLPEKRQNILLSATLSKDLQHIHQILLHDPVVIKIEAEEESLDLINQVAYIVSEEKKGPFLRYLINHHDMKQVLVFASSVHQADAIVNKLRKNNIDAKAIHSKKSQGARTEALQHFKSGKLRVLVATDLMARGIDINFLPFVINYELPRSPKDYVHRIGRTGRAEAAGDAISLVSQQELHHFEVIQKKMGKKVNLIDGENIL
ncbi:ATP-dependent RNA helicase RhlE [Pedobacter steynii]|uniref:ATP-dependent RNA helicase RhlE n=1 Tax=Pedobacter steynii TaxID=430522 RepID=A0A1H0KDL4_9SPHI|nr:DEAD/DEAH box helicase [Pedobacter steynii]NQX43263.1 DEAD/DEAH box helicase [Pedobacter steynii]SDO54048.1 ATP-dependent RNA helicase RhlE [Pedobacter steynii]